MKRNFPMLTALAALSLLPAACSKGSHAANTVQGPAPVVSGPVTDSGDSGLRPVPGATVAMGDPKHGAAIFSQNCSSCHGQNGAGGGIGPVLKGEKARKNYEQAIVWIKNPRSPMPKLYPSPLSEGDVADVAAYVETL